MSYAVQPLHLGSQGEEGSLPARIIRDSLYHASSSQLQGPTTLEKTDAPEHGELRQASGIPLLSVCGLCIYTTGVIQACKADSLQHCNAVRYQRAASSILCRSHTLRADPPWPIQGWTVRLSVCLSPRVRRFVCCLLSVRLVWPGLMPSLAGWQAGHLPRWPRRLALASSSPREMVAASALRSTLHVHGELPPSRWRQDHRQSCPRTPHTNGTIL